MPFAELLKAKQMLEKETQLNEKGFIGKTARRQGSAKMKIDDESSSGKNKPLELSSRKPVSRLRQVIELPSKSARFRDPRFDDLTGEFKEDQFHKNFAFLDEYRADELKQLKSKLVKEKDPDIRFKLKRSIQQLESKQQSNMEKQRQQELKRRLRKEEEERVSKGKKPFYIKKSRLPCIC